MKLLSFFESLTTWWPHLSDQQLVILYHTLYRLKNHRWPSVPHSMSSLHFEDIPEYPSIHISRAESWEIAPWLDFPNSDACAMHFTQSRFHYSAKLSNSGLPFTILVPDNCSCLLPIISYKMSKMLNIFPRINKKTCTFTLSLPSFFRISIFLNLSGFDPKTFHKLFFSVKGLEMKEYIQIFVDALLYQRIDCPNVNLQAVL